MSKRKKPAPAKKKTVSKPAAKLSKSKPKAAQKPLKVKPKSSASKKAPTKSVKKQTRPPIPAKSSSAKDKQTRPPIEVKGKNTRPPIPSKDKQTRPPISTDEKPKGKTKAPFPVEKSTPTKATRAPMPAPAPKATPDSKQDRANKARDALRTKILGNKKPAKPIAFTLDEVREIAKTVVSKAASEKSPTDAKAASKAAALKAAEAAKSAKPAAPHHVKAASLADILGFNPKKKQQPVYDDPETIPEKYRRYYKLLLDLRRHLSEGIDLHSEETLKRSSKDDVGDLSSYGQHMADSGTDTFDRDFALSLVANEQEALTEIEAAIKRIKDGTYGVCEASGKPIAKERLTAVPFTRFTAEAQKDIEKNRMRTRTAAGLFGELGEEGAKISDSEGGGDE